MTKVEQAGRVASLVHQRQVSEALAAGDAGRALVERTRRWSDDPREWPQVLVHQLVGCHEHLVLQARASDRMRDLVLSVAPASDAGDDKSRPVRPGSGDPTAAGAELTAGYEVYASAAQVAAVRLEHALAHGDEETASVLFSDLAHHDGASELRALALGVIELPETTGSALGGPGEAAMGGLEQNEVRFDASVDPTQTGT